MCPPTAPDRFACDHVSQAGNTGARGLNSYSTFLYPRYRLFWLHDDSGRIERLPTKGPTAAEGDAPFTLHSLHSSTSSSGKPGRRSLGALWLDGVVICSTQD